jgi:hypothetical protein
MPRYIFVSWRGKQLLTTTQLFRILLELDFQALGEGSTVDTQIWLAQMKSALGAAEVLASKWKEDFLVQQQVESGSRTREKAGLSLTKQSNLAKRTRLWAVAMFSPYWDWQHPGYGMKLVLKIYLPLAIQLAAGALQQWIRKTRSMHCLLCSHSWHDLLLDIRYIFDAEQSGEYAVTTFALQCFAFFNLYLVNLWVCSISFTLTFALVWGVRG